MSNNEFSIYKLLLNRFKPAILIGLIISIIIVIFLGKNSMEQYVFGLCIGIINFFLLTMGTDLILTKKPRFANLVSFLFFSFRYLAIAFAIVLFIIHKKANAFLVVGGLLTMNFSVFADEMKKHLQSRKEG